jgi:hypothetical protein
MATTLRQHLKNGSVVFVRFRKKDGSIRHMICTTNSSYIPNHLMPRHGMTYTPSQIRVYDLVAREWRSMIEENVEEFFEYTALVA